ncbi:MAG: hypothetical protein AVDCRST_MAG07-347, partial [uncultured Frankineae bacterium]
GRRARRRRGVPHLACPARARDQPPAGLVPARAGLDPRRAPTGGRVVVLRVEGRRGLLRRRRRRAYRAAGRLDLSRARGGLRRAAGDGGRLPGRHGRLHRRRRAGA